VNSLDWDRDGNLLVSDGSKLWRVDGTGKQLELSSDTSGDIVGLAPCSSAYILVNWEYHAGDRGSSIWRLNADGSNPMRLSNGLYDMAPACSPDGLWAYYFDSMQVLKRVPVAGGRPEVIALPIPHLDRILGTIAFSPDGHSLVALADSLDVSSGRAKPHLALLDMGKGRPVLSRLLEPDQRINAGSLHSGGVRFSPDGKSLVYAIKEKGIGNLWEQPLDGSPGHAVTEYTSDLVSQFRYSPDGNTLAIKRTHATSDIVVLRSSK
jgi:eukaryotic-like serine/threonine-protein kinase